MHLEHHKPHTVQVGRKRFHQSGSAAVSPVFTCLHQHPFSTNNRTSKHNAPVRSTELYDRNVHTNKHTHAVHTQIKTHTQATTDTRTHALTRPEHAPPPRRSLQRTDAFCFFLLVLFCFPGVFKGADEMGWFSSCR